MLNSFIRVWAGIIILGTFTGSSLSHAVTRRVLSLDGGGIRGILEARYLEAIEAAAQQPASKIFDVISGTSTGGLIALGLTMPKDGKPLFTAAQLVEFYQKKGNTIFYTSWPKWLNRGLTGPRYDESSLEGELQAMFGETTMLSQALIPVLVTAYNLGTESGLLFWSVDAKEHKETLDFPVWKVGRATSAAPTFFKPLEVEYPSGTGHKVLLVDGGLFRNNPSLFAYLKAKEIYPNDEIEVYSFGTGRAVKPVNAKSSAQGSAQWLSPVLHHMFVAVSQGDSDALSLMLNLPGKEHRYFRINTRLDVGRDRMDDISERNIQYLLSRADKVMLSKQFHDMVLHILPTQKLKDSYKEAIETEKRKHLTLSGFLEDAVMMQQDEKDIDNSVIEDEPLEPSIFQP